MFERASRLKVRFQYRGMLSVEDLWDLRVEDLDSLYKSLNARAKEQQEDSLLDTRSREDEILDLAIGIVKHVVAVKLQEAQAREDGVERRARKQKLMAVLEEKQDAELGELSADELKGMIEELG